MWPFKKCEDKLRQWRRVCPVIDSGKIFYKVMTYESDGDMWFKESCLDIFETKAKADKLAGLK